MEAKEGSLQRSQEAANGLVPILSQTNPIRILPHDFLKVHFNIVLPSMTRSSESSLLFSAALTHTLTKLQLRASRYEEPQKSAL
jgi:hypothetical protein